MCRTGSRLAKQPLLGNLIRAKIIAKHPFCLIREDSVKLDSDNKAAGFSLRRFPTTGVVIQIFEGNAIECLFEFLMQPIP